MEGQEVVTSDDQKLGTVIASSATTARSSRPGTVFKSEARDPARVPARARRRAARDGDQGRDQRLAEGRPRALRSCQPCVEHYGLDGTFEVSPDPDGLDSAETAGAPAGVQPAPAERLATLGGENDPSIEGPVIRDRQANAADPSGVTANLSDRNRTGGDK